jgi:hypothetical protein
MADDNEGDSPDRALRRFLEVVNDEAATNTRFRNRLLFAIGGPVIFAGQEDLATVDPVELAVRYDEKTFQRIYNTMTAAELRAVLKAPPNPPLASASDVQGKAKPALLVMLWSRARDRAEEKGRL